MRIGIIFFLIVGLNFCTAQTDFNKDIIGSWKLKTQTKSFTAANESKTSSDSINDEVDPLISSDVVLRFKQDEVLILDMKQFVLEASYAIKSNILTIGVRQFEIIGIENDVLRIKDTSTSKDLSYEYKRIKSNE